jgi:HD superfamily phosphodiesterase
MLVPEAKSIIMEHHLPDNIRNHSEKVCRVAKLIGDKYKEKGYQIDLENLISAALLHDLFRIADISEKDYEKLRANAEQYDQVTWDSIRNRYKGKSHSQAAYEFLTNKGEDKIALMVKKHYFAALNSENDKPVTLEEKILNYADKRVAHGKIVSLPERFSEGQKRHNPEKNNMKEIEKLYDAYYALEKELLDPIGLKPEDIKE